MPEEKAQQNTDKDALKVGDGVRQRSDDLTQAANAPMLIASFKDGPDGSKDAVAVCTRQGQPAGEYDVNALVKAPEPRDAAAEAKKAAEAEAKAKAPPSAPAPDTKTDVKPGMFSRKK